jgi:hypothetical protein
MDYKNIKQKAEKEVLDEIEREATRKYKEKMKELHNAKQVVKNIERELKDIDDELCTRFSDIKSNS